MKKLCIMFLLVTMSISSMEIGNYSLKFNKEITCEYIVYEGLNNMIPVIWDLNKKMQIYYIYEKGKLKEKGFKFSNFWLCTDYKAFNDLVYLNRSQMKWKARLIGVADEIVHVIYNVFASEQGEKVRLELQDTSNNFWVVLNISKDQLF